MNILRLLKHRISRVAIDDTPKTAEEWSRQTKEFNENHRFRFYLKKIVSFFETMIIRYFERPKDYLINRFKYRSHIIDTGLKKGQYHDVSELLFFGMMNVVKEKYYESWNYKNQKELYRVLTCEEVYSGKNHDPQQFENFILVTKTMIWWQNYSNRIKEIEDHTNKQYRKDMDFDNIMAYLDDSILTQEQRNFNRKNILETVKMEEILRKEKIEMMINIVNIHDSLW